MTPSAQRRATCLPSTSVSQARPRGPGSRSPQSDAAASSRCRQLHLPPPRRLRAGLSRDELLADVGSMRWGDFKPRLADALVAHLEPIQRRYAEVMQDEGALDAILAQVCSAPVASEVRVLHGRAQPADAAPPRPAVAMQRRVAVLVCRALTWRPSRRTPRSTT